MSLRVLMRRFGFVHRRHGHAGRSMTFGVMPPKEDFLAQAGHDAFTIEAHANSEDAKALRHAGVRPVGLGEYGKQRFAIPPERLYSVVERLADGDEESMGLASSIMTSLGYEWI